LNGVMKTAATALLIAAVLAGCGGGGKEGTTTPAATPPTSDLRPPTTPAAQVPTATTNTPPTHHRTKPQPLEPNSAKEPLRVGARYTCHGKPLKAISANGPVKVQPAIVKPGQAFVVTITDPNAKVAVVSLTGVAQKPIQSNAREQNGKLSATLKMPGYAGCGNKLIEVEGDLSAEAYVGVSR
jgi:hypothetical protein